MGEKKAVFIIVFVAKKIYRDKAVEKSKITWLLEKGRRCLIF